MVMAAKASSDVTTAAAATADVSPDTCISVISLWDGMWGGGKSVCRNSAPSNGLRGASPPGEHERPTNSQSQAVPICAAARESCLTAAAETPSPELDCLLQLNHAMAAGPEAELAARPADVQSQASPLQPTLPHQLQLHAELASELSVAHSQLSMHELELQSAMTLNAELATGTAQLVSDNAQLAFELTDAQSREACLLPSYEQQMQSASVCQPELVGVKSQLEILSGHELQLQKALALKAQLASELADAHSREALLLSSHEQQIQCTSGCEDELASEPANVKFWEERLLSSHEHQLQCAAAREEVLLSELAASKMMLLAALHLAEKVVDGHSSSHAPEPVHGAVGAAGGASADANTNVNGGIAAAVPGTAATAPGSVTTCAFAACAAPADAAAMKALIEAVSALDDGATQAPAEAAASVGVSVMQQLASDAATGCEHQISDLTRELEQARLSLQACYERMGGISVNLASKEHELKHAQPLFVASSQQPGDASASLAARDENSGESVQQLLVVCGQLSNLSASLAAKDVHLVHIQQLLLASVAQISDRNASLAAKTDELSSIQKLLAASDQKTRDSSAHSAALEAELGRLQQQPHVSGFDRCRELSFSLPGPGAVDAGEMESVCGRLEASDRKFQSAVAHSLSLEADVAHLQDLLVASAQHANDSLAFRDAEMADMWPAPFCLRTKPKNCLSEPQHESDYMDSLSSELQAIANAAIVRAMVLASVDKVQLKAELEEKLSWLGLAALKEEDSKLSCTSSSHSVAGFGPDSTPGSLFGGMWPADMECMMQQVVNGAAADEAVRQKKDLGRQEVSDVFQRGVDFEGRPLEPVSSYTPSEKSVEWHEVSKVFRTYQNAAVQVVPSDFDIESRPASPSPCSPSTQGASTTEPWAAIAPAAGGTLQPRPTTSGGGALKRSLPHRGPSNLGRETHLSPPYGFATRSSMQVAAIVNGSKQKVKGNGVFTPVVRCTSSPHSLCSLESGSTTQSEEPAGFHGRVHTGGLEHGLRAKPKQGFSRSSSRAPPDGLDSGPTTPTRHTQPAEHVWRF